MWLKSIQLKNTKGFIDTGLLELSKGINVLVSANNAGKSTILRSAQFLQPTDASNKFFENSIRSGAQKREISFELAEPNREQLNIPQNWNIQGWKPKFNHIGEPNRGEFTVLAPNGNFEAVRQQPICHQNEPANFIYPYFSRRKTTQFNLQINKTNTEIAVDGNQDGKKLIEKLRKDFEKHWPPEHFKFFSEEQFEKYYPKEFKGETNKVLAMPHGQAKQDAKGKLAESIVSWALNDREKAKKEFAANAEEILEFLGEIDKKLA
jgi:AAA15 family ATPase/GTPase